MKRPPDLQSWTTIRRVIRKASEQKVLQIYAEECHTFRRTYVIQRLIGAYLSKVRNRMRKESRCLKKK